MQIAPRSLNQNAVCEQYQGNCAAGVSRTPRRHGGGLLEGRLPTDHNVTTDCRTEPAYCRSSPRESSCRRTIDEIEQTRAAQVQTCQRGVGDPSRRVPAHAGAGRRSLDHDVRRRCAFTERRDPCPGLQIQRFRTSRVRRHQRLPVLDCSIWFILGIHRINFGIRLSTRTYGRPTLSFPIN